MVTFARFLVRSRAVLDKVTFGATKQAKSLIDPTLSFVGKQSTVLTEFVGKVGRGSSVDRVVAVVSRIPTRVSLVTVPLTVRTAGLVGMMVRLVERSVSGLTTAGSNSIVFLPFPVMTIAFECEASEFGQARESREM